MSSNFSDFKTTIPLSSNLFYKVRSLGIKIDQTDKTLSTLKFVEKYFKGITCLSLCNVNDDRRLILPSIERGMQ